MDIEKEVNALAGEAIDEALLGGPFHVIRLAFRPWRHEEEVIDELLLPILEELGCVGCSIELLDGPTLILRTHTFLEEGVDAETAHRRLVDTLQGVLPGGYSLKTDWAKVERFEQTFETEII